MSTKYQFVEIRFIIHVHHQKYQKHRLKYLSATWRIECEGNIIISLSIYLNYISLYGKLDGR